MNQEQKILELENRLNLLENQATIPHDVEQAFVFRLKSRFLAQDDIPSELSVAPRSAITSPSGGMTVDSQARTAIDSIITALEELGLVTEN